MSINLIFCKYRVVSDIPCVNYFCKCDEGWREQRCMVKIDVFGNGWDAYGCVEGVDGR